MYCKVPIREGTALPSMFLNCDLSSLRTSSVKGMPKNNLRFKATLSASNIWRSNLPLENLVPLANYIQNADLAAMTSV